MMVDPPALTYLTMDSVQAGVGASQVLPYVLRLAERGVAVTLHSFEPSVDDELRPRLEHAGIRWHPHPFGPHGAVGGLGRVVTAARAVQKGALVHARSDMAAAATLTRRHRAWVWDVRSFWVDQRIASGSLKAGSPAERVLRRIERRAARSSTAIVTLTQAAIDELVARHGAHVRRKATVVTTCVDVERFSLTPLPLGELKLLLSGSFNPLYDLDATLRFVSRVRALRSSSLALLRPDTSPWDDAVIASGGHVGSSTFEAMPANIASHHAGLSILRADQPAAVIAAMPTKIGEFLACGRPVVVSRGLGDCDELFAGSGAGVVLDGTDDSALDRAARELLTLVDAPETAAKCRELAMRHFNLDVGVQRLLDVYRSAASGA